MFVKRYKIEHIAESDQDQAGCWRIELELEPSWFDRTFMGIIFNRTHTLKGNYSVWRWEDNQEANIFWSLWADCAVKKHKTDHGTSYLYRDND